MNNKIGRLQFLLMLTAGVVSFSLLRLDSAVAGSQGDQESFVKALVELTYESTRRAPVYPHGQSSPKDFVSRWQEDIEIAWIGFTPETQKILQSLAVQLDAALPISVMAYKRSVEKDPNVVLVIAAKKDMPKYMDAYRIKDEVQADIMAQPDCRFALTTKPDGVIHFGMGFIFTDRNKANGACLFHTVMAIAGLVQIQHVENDLGQSPPDRDWSKLNPGHRMMLRALYDDRIKPGMDSAEAQPIFKEIMTELVDQELAK